MATLQELGLIQLEMRIGLDTYHPKVRVTQYDSGLTLEYDIVDRNGEVVTSLPDVIPMLYVEAPDKSAIGSAEGEIVDGKAIIPIPSSLLSKFGEAEAQVQLVNSKTKEQIHDNTFVLDIAQSKMDGEVTPGESIWFNLQDLKEAIESVQQLEEQYDTDVAAVETMRDDVTAKHGEVTTMPLACKTSTTPSRKDVRPKAPEFQPKPIGKPRRQRGRMRKAKELQPKRIESRPKMQEPMQKHRGARMKIRGWRTKRPDKAMKMYACLEKAQDRHRRVLGRHCISSSEIFKKYWVQTQPWSWRNRWQN